MRFAILLYAVVSVSAFAQDPVPDTTDWHSYFPLEVGNEWQYRVDNVIPNPDYHFSRTVLGDSLVNDTTFYQFRRCRQDAVGPVTCYLEVELYTLDENYAALMYRWEGPEGPIIYRPAVICRLDSPFGELGEEWCYDTGPGTFVDGEYGANWPIGGSSVTGTRKSYSWIGGGEVYLSGIGHVASYPDGGGGSTTIQYARIAGVEYGNPVVSNETDLPQPQSEIRAFPNPALREATLQFSLPERQKVVARVFNLRGALVETRSLAAVAGGVEVSYTFDVSSWPSGLYTIRLIGDRGFSATRGIIVIH